MVATPAEADSALLCRRAASHSSVSMFLRDMGDFRVLTRRQEGRLFQIYQRGRHLDALGGQLSADEQQVGRGGGGRRVQATGPACSACFGCTELL